MISSIKITDGWKTLNISSFQSCSVFMKPKVLISMQMLLLMHTA